MWAKVPVAWALEEVIDRLLTIPRRRHKGRHPTKSVAGLEQRWRLVVGQGGRIVLVVIYAHAHFIPFVLLTASFTRSRARYPCDLGLRDTNVHRPSREVATIPVPPCSNPTGHIQSCPPALAFPLHFPSNPPLQPFVTYTHTTKPSTSLPFLELSYMSPPVFPPPLFYLSSP